MRIRVNSVTGLRNLDRSPHPLGLHNAVVWILRKCVWWVPDFSVAAYRDKLKELDEHMRAGRPFIAHSTRHLIDAQRNG